MTPAPEEVRTSGASRRLALQPLLDALPIDYTLARADVRGPGVITQAARLLDVSTRTLHRLRGEGLSERTADHLAVAAGLHPLLVWGEAWSRALARSEPHGPERAPNDQISPELPR